MNAFDLDAYLARIGHSGRPRADLETLRGLQFAHLCAVPFENLDIHLGVPISLDIEHLFEKIVSRRRGGYCFEQNTLFLRALRETGFDVTPREARVGSQDAVASPRDHMVIEVAVDGAGYFADAGFGADSSLYPLRIGGPETSEDGRTFRTVDEEGLDVAQRLSEGVWRDLYVVQPGEPSEADYEVANWYTSTHPESGFVLTPTVQLQSLRARRVLRRRTYTRTEGGVETKQRLSDAEIRRVLRDEFRIDLGEDVGRIDFDGRGDH